MICSILEMKDKTKQKLKQIYFFITTGQLEGVGVIEVILILVIIIGLVLIFRNQIEAIMKNAFASINSDASGISETIVVQ